MLDQFKEVNVTINGNKEEIYAMLEFHPRSLLLSLITNAIVLADAFSSLWA